MMDYDEKHWSRPCPKVDCRKKACECGLLYKTIPAALGDDSSTSAVAPKNGAYCNSIVEYEANGHIYLYGSDGIPVEIEGDGEGGVSNFNALLNRPKYAGEEMTSETDIPDVTAAVETEATARARADATLQDNITAEATARANADTALQNSITAETNARTDADSTLRGDISALTNRVTTAESDIDSIEEVIPAQASDQNQLADKNFVNSSVATNTANYISDNGQPFTSVAALEAYSGTLTNNDYAFVTGTDAQGNTFYDRYKYNAGTQAWAFEYELNNSSFTAVQWAAINSGITSGDVTKLQGLANIRTVGANLALTNGELSATDTTYTAGNGLSLTGTQFSVNTTTIATQSDLTAGLANKQDTLTAGSNIQINNDTISATDTTYSDFTGTDGTTSGTSGLVPAPATTDAGKFLKADGTWDTAGGGSSVTVVQAKGTSTTDVMSQDATTKMIYPSYSTQPNAIHISGSGGQSTGSTSIAIGSNAVAYSLNAIALGGGTTGTDTARAYNQGDIAIGASSQAGIQGTSSRYRNTVVGYSARATGSSSVALGYSARTYASTFSVAAGQSAEVGTSTADVTSGVAIGSSAKALAGYSVAIGSGSSATVQGEFNIAQNGTNGYNGSAYRLLTGLYDPQSDHDAANKEFVDNGDAISGWRVPVGTCSTEASTLAKVTTDVALVGGGKPADVNAAGTIIAVLFTQKNSVASATLSVNGATAMPIQKNGQPVTPSAWTAGDRLILFSDGSNWNIKAGASEVWYSGEMATNERWTDGKIIYRKLVAVAGTGGQTADATNAIPANTTAVRIEGFFQNGGDTLPVNQYYNSNAWSRVYTTDSTGTIHFQLGSAYTSATAEINVYYIKNT